MAGAPAPAIMESERDSKEAWRLGFAALLLRGGHGRVVVRGGRGGGGGGGGGVGGGGAGSGGGGGGGMK